MGTRKIKDAKDLTTNELIYFKSHAKATYTSDGSTVLDKLENLKDTLKTKQDTLISGTNIKTINGISLLGSEDITINGGSVYTFNYTGLTSIAQEEWNAIQLAEVIQLVIHGVYTPVYADKNSNSVSFLITNDVFLSLYFRDISAFIEIIVSNDLQVGINYLNKSDLNVPIVNNINKNLSLSSINIIRDNCRLLHPWLSMTFMISDSNDNCSSRDTIYIDTEDMKLHLFHSAANEAVRLLFTNGEAYYYVQGFNIPLIGNIAGGWYSQSISKWITLPKTPLKTARVGDFITFTRVDVPASDFYSKYIDFDSINLELDSGDRIAFNTYKSSLGLSSLSDGLFIKYLIVNGYINTCSTNPKKSPSALLYPLAVDGMVTTYVAQITPNTENFYSGLFWSDNMTGPGIYSYVTKGRPAGSEDGEFYTGYVSPDGAQTLISMKDPSKAYTRAKIGDTWTKLAFGVGKNIGGTGEIFNDYTNNKAHADHAHAEGLKTNAYSYNAHAEGYNTQAGHNAHSEGYLTKADGQNSHAEGDSTIASGFASHTEGRGTQATNNASHAEGYNTSSQGSGSHSEGLSTIAKGNGSHAEGAGTRAEGDFSHAEGVYNYYNIPALIHSVGIGVGALSAGDESYRTNAHAITSDGKHYIYGIGGYEGKGIENAKDLASCLGGGSYDSKLNDDLKMTTAVGGIAVNTTAKLLKGKTYTELFDAILFPDQNPSYTDASVTNFTLSSSTSPVEVGSNMITITNGGDLNRGSWDLYNLQPDDTKLPYAGIETSRKYEFSVNGKSYTSTSGVPSITDTTFNKPGNNTFKVTIYYDAGASPKNNKGATVDSIAAAAGSKSSNHSINVTYPFWILLKGNTEATKKVLACSIGTTTGTISFNKIGTLPAVNNTSGNNPVLFKVKGTLTTLKKVNTLNASAPIDMLGELVGTNSADGYTEYRYKAGTAVGEQEINNGTITFNL